MSRDVHFAGNEQWNWEELTKVNHISNAPNNLIFGSMLEEFEDERQEESEDKRQEESEDERQEESKDERQDALVDDAPVRGGAFDDREK